MNRYEILKAELTTDPLVRGYSGMTDQQVADDMNTKYRTRNLETLSGSIIFEAIDETEYIALNAAAKERLGLIIGLGDSIQIGPSSRTRTWLLNMFGAGTNTRTNLVAAVQQSITRADELGITVEAGTVAYARTL